MVGLTVGFASVEVNPLGELVHEYKLPAKAVSPSAVGVPAHTVALVAIDALGIDIVSEFVFAHPVVVFFSVNI